MYIKNPGLKCHCKNQELDILLAPSTAHGIVCRVMQRFSMTMHLEKKLRGELEFTGMKLIAKSNNGEGPKQA